MILDSQSRLINNYLSKGLSIIEQGSKQLKLITNDVKLRINLVDQLETYYFIAEDKEISAVVNIIKKLHIHKNMHMIYKQDFYKTIEKEMYDLFLEYILTVIDDIENPALIE